MRLRVWFVVLVSLVAASVAVSANAAANDCTGDFCLVTGGFSGLQADIAGSGASAPVISLLTNEVALAQRLHPPSPCYEGHPPGPCTPASSFLPSAYLLVLVDYQVASMVGLVTLTPSGPLRGVTSRRLARRPFPTCGSCGLSLSAARRIDGDIRTMFADRTMFPAGIVSLPQFFPASS